MSDDREIREFRDLMMPPERFEDGFGVKAVLGSLFVGLVMMPASLYLGLIAGGDLGPAARWVTVILFIEVARRSFTTMSRPEIFILYYMAGAAIANPFSGLLWNQFLVQSEPARAMGVAEFVPGWVAPGADVLDLRTFIHRGWLPAMVLLVIGQAISRLDHFGLGYVLFRITSDVERLPFPMAPVAGLGVTALAESSHGTGTWRWRVFSIGSMIGLLFGALYVGLPAVTGALLRRPIQLFPIPWVELTTTTQDVLPAVPMGLSLDLGHLLVGMVLPFFAMVGSFVGLVITMIANPILHHVGYLTTWTPNMDTVRTQFSNHVDFYLSFSIGLAMAIAMVGFWQVGRAVRRFRRQSPGTSRRWAGLFKPPAGRGDFSLWIAVGIYLTSTASYILICKLWLVPEFPLWILLAYGLVYTPLISYVSARMEGIAGQVIEIPMIREVTFIMSGYTGVAIWFAPIPLHNYGQAVVNFRTVELTGTRFTSLIKAELVMFPAILVSAVLFSQLIWRLAPIPSAAYPYTQKVWELQAMNRCLVYSSTLPGGYSPFFEALKPEVIGAGVVLGLGAYGVLAMAGLPVMLVYGVVRGLGQSLPQWIVPQFIGALIGRYYFQKRLGVRWRQYAPVLLAGFSCGVGLVTMLALGFVFITKAVFQLPY